MKTYKINFDYTHYQNLDLDIEAVAEALESALDEEQCFDYSWHNLSLLPHWEALNVDIQARFIDNSLNTTKLPDITVWQGSSLVLSAAALDTLQTHLKAYGEFLPITINQSPYYLFNCLNAVDVDSSKSQADIDNGLWMGVKSIGFSEAVITNNLVFKTRFDRCSALYCGQAFKELIATSAIEGLLFTENLVEDL